MRVRPRTLQEGVFEILRLRAISASRISLAEMLDSHCERGCKILEQKNGCRGLLTAVFYCEILCVYLWRKICFAIQARVPVLLAESRKRLSALDEDIVAFYVESPGEQMADGIGAESATLQ